MGSSVSSQTLSRRREGLGAALWSRSISAWIGVTEEVARGREVFFSGGCRSRIGLDRSRSIPGLDAGLDRSRSKQIDRLGSEQMREDGGGAIGEQIGADWGFCCGLWSRVGGWGFDAGFCGCWFRVDLLGSEQMREDGGGAIGEQIGADWGFCCGLWSRVGGWGFDAGFCGCWFC